MLPECPLQHRAYPHDIVGNLGGYAQLAGVDLQDTLPTSVKDHPWLGQTVVFPLFVDDGYVDGKVLNCIVHPQGRLMFDVQFPEPVPPIHGREIVLRNNRDYHQQIHRFFGDNLAKLAGEDTGKAVS